MTLNEKSVLDNGDIVVSDPTPINVAEKSIKMERQQNAVKVETVEEDDDDSYFTSYEDDQTTPRSMPPQEATDIKGNTTSVVQEPNKVYEDDQTTPRSMPPQAATGINENTTSIVQEPNKVVVDITKDVSDEKKHLVKEAGQGGAVLGFLVGGPIGSALLGFGSAYAVRKKDSTGKAARSLGKFTMSVKEKASKVENKHRFLEKSKSAIGNFCGDTEENRARGTTTTATNNIASKARSSAISGWKVASKFTKDNQLIERGVEGTGKGIEFVEEAITKFHQSNKKKSSTQTTASPSVGVPRQFNTATGKDPTTNEYANLTTQSVY